MYPFNLTFEDGTVGEANSKSQQPPYQVGDEMEYTINGQTPKGTNKIKVQKPQQEGGFPGGGGGFQRKGDDIGQTIGNAAHCVSRMVASGKVPEGEFISKVREYAVALKGLRVELSGQPAATQQPQQGQQQAGGGEEAPPF